MKNTIRTTQYPGKKKFAKGKRDEVESFWSRMKEKRENLGDISNQTLWLAWKEETERQFAGIQDCKLF